MPIWQWIKNNLPSYAEQITINEEVEQIQETLSKFSQPVPSNFKKLENLKHMCSTQGWKEPICERYNCLINGEWKQVDITHTLLEKLGLEKVKNIPYPAYISSTVLNKGLDHYFAYNVEDEEKIFLERPFAVENLEEDINKLFDKIRSDKKTVEDLEQEVKELKNELAKEKSWWDKWMNNTTVESSEERIFLGQKGINKNSEIRISIYTNIIAYYHLEKENGIRDFKKIIKLLSEYYKNQ